MGLVELSNDSTVDDVVNVLKQDGGVIIRDFISEDNLALLTNDLTPVFAKTPPGEDESFLGQKTRRLSRLFSRTKHAAGIAMHPLFFGAAEDLLCGSVPIWQGSERVDITPELRIGAAQAIQIWPGETAQPLHRDDSVFLWRHPTYGREARLQIMVAVSDFTADNGGTMVIPKSHHWDDELKPMLSEAQPLEMQAGCAMLFLGSTYHGGGANTSRNPRTGVSIALDCSTLRQEENVYLSMTPQEVAAYPEEFQRLLGWSAGRNFMGWIEDNGKLIDPIELVNSDRVYEHAAQLEGELDV